jgi:hypothetical protein
MSRQRARWSAALICAAGSLVSHGNVHRRRTADPDEYATIR